MLEFLSFSSALLVKCSILTVFLLQSTLYFDPLKSYSFSYSLLSLAFDQFAFSVEASLVVYFLALSFFPLFYASTEVYRDLIFLKLCLIFLPTLRHFFLHYILSYLLNNLLLFCQHYFLKVFVKGSKNQIVIEHFHPTLKSYIN